MSINFSDNLKVDKIPKWINEINKIEGKNVDKETVKKIFDDVGPGAEIIAREYISDDNLLQILNEIGDKRLKEEIDELISMDKISQAMEIIHKKGYYKFFIDALQTRIKERKPNFK